AGGPRLPADGEVGRRGGPGAGDPPGDEVGPAEDHDLVAGAQQVVPAHDQIGDAVAVYVAGRDRPAAPALVGPARGGEEVADELDRVAVLRPGREHVPAVVQRRPGAAVERRDAEHVQDAVAVDVAQGR